MTFDSDEPVGTALEVALLGEAGCATGCPRVRGGVVTGHLQQVGTDGVEAVPARGPWTIAMAIALFIRTTGVGQSRCSWTTGQLAAWLLREVQAIDPDYTRRSYQRAVRDDSVCQAHKLDEDLQSDDTSGGHVGYRGRWWLSVSRTRRSGQRG